MINRSLAVLAWLVNLFNPPPRDSMSLTQKIGRIFLVALTLTISCILAAMLEAVIIFVIQRGHAMLSSIPELLSGLEIILAGICVNAVCVAILLQIRKADRKLIPPIT